MRIDRLLSVLASALLLVLTHAAMCSPPTESASRPVGTVAHDPGTASASRDLVTIAEHGVPRAVIVVAPDSSPADRHAAKELAGFLKQVTGGQFAIRFHPETGSNAIFVGIKAAIQAEPALSTSGLGTDGIIIRTVGGNLILAGGEPRGTLYAVYSFLEDQVGCHWWSSMASTIPSRPTLHLPALDIRYVPRIEYRCMQYLDARDGDFSVRNKLNGDWHRVFIDDGINNAREDPRLGGRKYAFHKWVRWSRGSFGMMIERHVYVKDHPQWFAALPRNKPAEPYVCGAGPDGLPSLEGGELIRPRNLEDLDKPPFDPAFESLCLTDPDMLKEFVRNLKLGIIWSPVASWVDVSQPDADDCCRCDACMAVAREEGAYSGVVIRFVNAVADELAKTPYANLPVHTMAYHYSRKPPRDVKPRDNVIVQLDISFDFLPKPNAPPTDISYSRPLTHPRNKSMHDDLVGWSKICKHLDVWDYVCDHASALVPYPNLRVLGPNMKFYADHNVTGVFEETYCDSPGTEMAELRAWVVAKLMWNPNLDGWKLVEEFSHGYYGRAGDEILAYLNIIHDAVEASDDWLNCGMGYGPRFLSFDTLDKSWAHLKAAEKIVASDPEQRLRVRVAQLPVLMTFLMRWDELRNSAKSAGAAWPLGDSMKDVLDTVLEVAQKKGIALEVLTGEFLGKIKPTGPLAELLQKHKAQLDADATGW